MSAIASNVVQLLWVFYRAYTETAHAQYEALHETQTEVQQLQLVLTQLSYLIGESEATYGVSNWTTDLREIERCLKDNKKVLEKFVLNLQRRLLNLLSVIRAPRKWLISVPRHFPISLLFPFCSGQALLFSLLISSLLP